MKDLRVWCRNNWNLIPAPQRQLCIDHLREFIGDITQVEKYQDEPWFHMHGGMQIRNNLREVITDDKLPPVWQESYDTFARNWDDFYTGAIDELLEQSKQLVK